MMVSARALGRASNFSMRTFVRGLVAAGATLLVAGAQLVLPAQAVDPTEVEVIVRVMGTADGNGVAKGIAGVELELFRYNTAGSWLVNEAWSKCVSDDNGNCSFLIPASYVQTNTLPNYRARPVAGQTWVYSPLFWPYAQPILIGEFTTQNLSSNFGRTYTTNPITVQAPNPTLSAACSLDIALVMDYSGSMNGYEAAMRNAADAFVDALA